MRKRLAKFDRPSDFEDNRFRRPENFPDLIPEIISFDHRPHIVKQVLGGVLQLQGRYLTAGRKH